MSEIVLMSRDEIADLIRKTALAVADDLREDLRRNQLREIMNKSEIADYLGCSTATINRYMAQGMPFEKIDNGHPLFRRAEVDNWMRLETCRSSKNTGVAR